MSNEESNSNAGGGNGTTVVPDEAVVTPIQEGASLADKLAAAERERADAHDRMLRVAADFENYKKRVRREVDEGAQRAKEQILREVLPVLDNFERALVAATKAGAEKSGGAAFDSLATGVKLVEKQLHGALEKFGVKGFDARGEAFDPARHEAIQQVETDAHPTGTVVDVFARGYLIGEKLLRAAMVSVAKGKPAPAPADDNNDPSAQPN